MSYLVYKDTRWPNLKTKPPIKVEGIGDLVHYHVTDDAF